MPKMIPAPFIIGASRSGTTLLRMMLDAHPDLAIPPETHFIPRLARKCEIDANPESRFLKILLRFPTWADFQIDADILSQRVLSSTRFDLGESLRVFYRMYAERFSKPRWGDKTPDYLGYMKLIQSILPEAHFVHIIRDGRDVAMSINNLWFGPNSISEAAEWWVRRITKARKQAEGLDYYLEIRYEDLVAEPEAVLGGVCAFIDLQWHPAMLGYYKAARERLAEVGRDMTSVGGTRMETAEERMGIHALTRKPPEVGRTGRWRKEMSVSERQCFERIAGQVLEQLGYEIG